MLFGNMGMEFNLFYMLGYFKRIFILENISDNIFRGVYLDK